MSQFEHCTVTHEGRVCIITINRPDVMNALHRPANLELQQAFDDFESNPDLWVAILTGAGETGRLTGNETFLRSEGWSSLVRRRHDYEFPAYSFVVEHPDGLEITPERKQKVRFCRRCFNVSEHEECRICRDARRDPSVLCVVEEPRDLMAIEKTAEFRGRYHVLGGAISPIDGIGPEQLRIRELLGRLSDDRLTEVILATDPNLEGEATATYLTRLLRPMGLRVTRLASGLPVGGDLEYADEVTLGRAFEGRRAVDE